jgi:hypothetical protein
LLKNNDPGVPVVCTPGITPKPSFMTTYSSLLLYTLFVLLFLAGWTAFIIRHRQLRRLKKQVEELEKEMLHNHRELLKLETELARRAMAAKNV